MRGVSRLLLETGLSNPDKTNENGDTALMMALLNELSDIANMILDTGNANVSAISKKMKHTALIYACDRNMEDLAIRIYQSDNTNSHIVDNFGENALMISIRNKLYRVSEFLLINDRDKNYFHLINEHHDSLLTCAIESNYLGAFNQLIKYFPLDMKYDLAHDKKILELCMKLENQNPIIHIVLDKVHRYKEMELKKEEDDLQRCRQIEIEILNEEEQEKKRDKKKKSKKNKSKTSPKHLEQQRLEQQRLEQQRLEKERLKQEQLEQQRLERERLKQERLERERLEREQLKQKQLEQRLERERLKQEQLEQQRLEKERLQQQCLEQERLEQERLEQERLEQERLERERLEQQRLEQERLERERLEQKRLEQQTHIPKSSVVLHRLEQKRLEQERLEQERLEEIRLLKQQLAQLTSHNQTLERRINEFMTIDNTRMEQIKTEQEFVKQIKMEYLHSVSENNRLKAENENIRTEYSIYKNREIIYQQKIQSLNIFIQNMNKEYMLRNLRLNTINSTIFIWNHALQTLTDKEHNPLHTIEIMGKFVKIGFHDKNDKSYLLGYTQFMPLLTFYEDFSSIFRL